MRGENYQLELMTGGSDFSISCLVGKIVIGFFLVILFLVLCIVIISKIISPFDGKPPRAQLFIVLNKSAPNFAAMDTELKKILADDRIKNYYKIKVFRSSDKFGPSGQFMGAKTNVIMLAVGESIKYEYADTERRYTPEVPFTHENILSMLKKYTYINGEPAAPNAVRIERNPAGLKRMLEVLNDAQLRAQEKKFNEKHAAEIAEQEARQAQYMAALEAERATYDNSMVTIIDGSTTPVYTS